METIYTHTEPALIFIATLFTGALFRIFFGFVIKAWLNIGVFQRGLLLGLPCSVYAVLTNTVLDPGVVVGFFLIDWYAAYTAFSGKFQKTPKDGKKKKQTVTRTRSA